MSETNEDITPQSREIDHTFYRKEPKRVISFNLLTFFHADINQSEVEDSFELASHWNVNKTKAVTPLAPYCNVLWRWEQVRALPPPHTNDCGTIGSLRNDGNENGKKAIGLDKQNNNFARASRFFVHFSAVVARLQRETA